MDKPQEEYKITLFPFQQLIFDDPSRFKVIAAGRRVGKSYLACVMAYNHCLEQGGRRVLLIGPTVSMIKEAMWTTLKGLIHPEHIEGFPREIDLEIRLINGSKITLKGFDRPDSLRGMSPSPTLIILDEFAYLKGGAFSEVVLPMTSDPIRKAKIVAISTPKGIGNDFHKLFVMGQEKKNGWKSWHFTAVNARKDMAEQIDLARATMDPLLFNQEYEANFQNTGSSVFYQFDRSINVSDCKLIDNEDLHIAIDFNVRIMASSVFVHRGNQLHCINEFYGSSDTSQLIRRINGTYSKVNRDIYVYPDPSGKAMKSSAPTGQTDFTLLREGKFKIRSRSKAPPIIDSVNAVNAMLKDANGNSRLFFDRNKATKTIESIELTSWKEGVTQGMDNASIDKTRGYEHFSDGVRYLVEYIYPLNRTKPKIIRDVRFTF